MKLSDRIAGSARGRYWVSKLSNRVDFQPLFNVMANRLRSGLRQMRDLGFHPDLIVDIGAYRGDWSRVALPIFPGARFLLLEAQEARHGDLATARLIDPARIDFRICVLGAEPAEATPFHLMESGSSLYHDVTAFPRETVHLPVTTLDAVMVNGHVGGRLFLKLDVQGAEIDVLRGGPRTVARADAVLLEASLVEFNRGAPRIAEMLGHMREMGFVLHDIWDLRRIGPVLAQVDLLFARNGSLLDRKARETIEGFGAHQLGA